ncbi:hypothetical protein L7F22_041364, partial [Adiantum nelumboides]|nr:hypothetical protein [Adiantum nelumboides]
MGLPITRREIAWPRGLAVMRLRLVCRSQGAQGHLYAHGKGQGQLGLFSRGQGLLHDYDELCPWFAMEQGCP